VLLLSSYVGAGAAGCAGVPHPHLLPYIASSVSTTAVERRAEQGAECGSPAQLVLFQAVLHRDRQVQHRAASGMVCVGTWHSWACTSATTCTYDQSPRDRSSVTAPEGPDGPDCNVGMPGVLLSAYTIHEMHCCRAQAVIAAPKSGLSMVRVRIQRAGQWADTCIANM
jgi:hypothetical protein